MYTFEHASSVFFHLGLAGWSITSWTASTRSLPPLTTGAHCHNWTPSPGRADSQPARCEALSALSIIQAETETSGTAAYTDNKIRRRIIYHQRALSCRVLFFWSALQHTSGGLWDGMQTSKSSLQTKEWPCCGHRFPLCKTASFKTLLLAALWARVATS